MHHHSRFCVSAGLVVLLALALQLSVLGLDQDNTQNDLRGVIVEVKKLDAKNNTDARYECLVEKVKNKDYPTGKVYLRLIKGSKLEKIVAGQREPAQFSELTKGTVIEFSGIQGVDESLPPIAYVKSIVIQEAQK